VELELLKLSNGQLRVVLAMRHLETRWGSIDATMEDLAELTGFSRSSVHRAVQGLIDSGWLEVERTKRNYGLWSSNKYTLLRGSTRDTSVGKVVPLRGVTGGTSTNVIITTSKTSTTKPTSKLNKTSQEETVVNRWSDDDEVGGFGLLEGEVPASQKPKKTPRVVEPRKSNYEKRMEREPEDWTAQMMASEFASRVYDKIRGIPGMVNTKDLAIALATNRKRFGVTAAQEYAALEALFADERNLLTMKKMPKKCHGVFLNAITNWIAAHGENVPSAVAKPAKDVYVYASDGTEFDNSMGGRLELAEYEQKLKG
jgi:hypothetical protein